MNILPIERPLLAVIRAFIFSKFLKEHPGLLLSADDEAVKLACVRTAVMTLLPAPFNIPFDIALYACIAALWTDLEKAATAYNLAPPLPADRALDMLRKVATQTRDVHMCLRQLAAISEGAVDIWPTLAVYLRVHPSFPGGKTTTQIFSAAADYAQPLSLVLSDDPVSIRRVVWKD